MKNIVTTFLDYQKATQLEQETLIQKLMLEDIMIRNIDGKPFLEISDSDFERLVNLSKVREVCLVDPNLPTYDFNDEENQTKINEQLELVASKAKILKSKNLIYRIPKFKDINDDKVAIINLIKHQISIIKKYKIDILIMPGDGHKTALYRLILETLKEKNIKVVYDPVYLYKNNEALVTALRLLRDYTGLLLVDDCDELYVPRLIGTTKTIDLREIFKKFVTNNYQGIVALDTSLVDLYERVENYKWYEKTFSKVKREEIKVVNEFKLMNKETSNFKIIDVQLKVLNVIFLNKK